MTSAAHYYQTQVISGSNLKIKNTYYYNVVYTTYNTPLARRYRRVAHSLCRRHISMTLVDTCLSCYTVYTQIYRGCAYNL